MIEDRKELIEMYPKRAKDILAVNGRDFVKNIGNETIKNVILDVLCGVNIRGSTEAITRKRIAIANGGLLLMFLEGCKKDPLFIEKLPKFAAQKLKEGKLKKEEGWILNWLLGLTDKAVQNILRDDSSKITQYAVEFENTVGEVAREYEQEFGALRGDISINGESNSINWKDMMLVMSAIGAQTLTIRGSEKSTYGKLFEKLILGSLLSILGFEFVDKDTNKSSDKVFWLSERADKRESDATLLYELGKGIRFDIGFIGRGNPEISLDKVSRFEKKMDYAKRTHIMATIIIVDRIGERSRIVRLAEEIDGTIVQMSMSYWPRTVATRLKDILGYENEILKVKDEDMRTYLSKKMEKVPVADFLKGKEL